MDDQEKIMRIMHFVEAYGGIDGAHHKQWVIDQITRIALEDDYADWVERYQAGVDGPHTYEWDQGIAP